MTCFFFFFKQKTAYEMLRSLVGSEMCIRDRVYTFGPTFRAENSNTSRHANEFWMIEPEMAFTDLNGNMDLAEEIVKYLIQDVRQNCPDELELFAKFVDKELLGRLE